MKKMFPAGTHIRRHVLYAFKHFENKELEEAIKQLKYVEKHVKAWIEGIENMQENIKKLTTNK